MNTRAYILLLEPLSSVLIVITAKLTGAEGRLSYLSPQINVSILTASLLAKSSRLGRSALIVSRISAVDMEEEREGAKKRLAALRPVAGRAGAAAASESTPLRVENGARMLFD